MVVAIQAIALNCKGEDTKKTPKTTRDYGSHFSSGRSSSVFKVPDMLKSP